MENNLITPLIKIEKLVPVMEQSITAFFKSHKTQTSKTYLQSLSNFFGFLDDSNNLCAIELLSSSHVRQYINHLEQEGKSPNTIRKEIAAISSLFDFLVREEIVSKNIVKNLKRPKAQNKKEFAALTKSEVNLVFLTLNTKRKSYPLHRALLAVGFYTGLRGREILNLKIQDYAQYKQIRVFKLKIKGDIYRTIPLHPFVVECIDFYIAQMEEKSPFKSDDFLFQPMRMLKSKKKGPLQLLTFLHVLKTALKNAGINREDDFFKYSSHLMRSSLATILLNDQNTALDEVQEVLGHKSPTTTTKYIKRKKDLLKSPLLKIQ